MQSNLQSLPSFLSIYSVPNKPNNGEFFGFDSTGLWFLGNASIMPPGEVAFPIRTNFSFSENDIVEVIFTLKYQSSCADHGVCFFPSSQEPEWCWCEGTNCLSFKLNCGVLELDGLTSIVGGMEEGPQLPQEDGVYTCKLTYNPIVGNLTAFFYYGEGTNGELFGSLTLNEKLPPGDFRIGLDADADLDDVGGVKSYFTSIQINSISSTKSCSQQVCETAAFKCYVGTTHSCTCSTMQYFYGAYVPAIVVCNQRLS